MLTDGDGDGHGSVKGGGLDDPAVPIEAADPAELVDADGATDWACVDACGLLAPRLVDEPVTAGLAVPDEPGWVGEVSLDVGAGLVDVGTGLVEVTGGELLVTGGGELLPDPPGFGLVLTGGELPTEWHFVAAGELAVPLEVFAGAPEPVGNCEAPLEAGCWPVPPPDWPGS